MTLDFEELDYQRTPFGDISLRRRAEPRLQGKILYEVKLGEEFLLSSLFTAAEVALAKLGLDALGGEGRDVVVGGLGLGHTAMAALEHPALGSLSVVEVMAPVIDWHRRGLVPLGGALVADKRCTLVQGDFFALASSPGGFHPGGPARRVDAVLLDIDHSPRHWLNPGNAAFYSEPGLRGLADKLLPGGVFGLWSDDAPDAAFMRLLATAFDAPASHVVAFPNPYTGGESSNTVYLARKRGA